MAQGGGVDELDLDIELLGTSNAGFARPLQPVPEATNLYHPVRETYKGVQTPLGQLQGLWPSQSVHTSASSQVVRRSCFLFGLQC